jgi:hypothetical protein
MGLRQMQLPPGVIRASSAHRRSACSGLPTLTRLPLALSKLLGGQTNTAVVEGAPMRADHAAQLSFASEAQPFMEAR